ncbi:MAG TPA: DNA-processing protein DprA [Acidimicrobiia bacterium]|nr:DNA-processing protein DprA [Acidimicrobiia bacterium]
MTALGQVEIPAYLDGVPALPARLWLLGTFPPSLGVAIVGTRRSTSYGNGVASALARAVSGAGWPVISGLARGIDGVAHTACVEAGEPGWAVLGSGLDIVYPRQNESLARRLVELGGGLISEYPPGTPPAPYRFPARNRIIAALSAAVVVVEAAVTGGALITARLALELGRDVLAVPGDINRAVSEGSNLLIRDGAHPVLGPEDLIETLAYILGPPPRTPPSPPARAEDVDALIERSGGPIGETLASLTRSELGI